METVSYAQFAGWIHATYAYRPRDVIVFDSMRAAQDACHAKAHWVERLVGDEGFIAVSGGMRHGQDPAYWVLTEGGFVELARSTRTAREPGLVGPLGVP